MRAVNMKEAKAHLNELVDAATRGEEVVLMRGSTHVAAIVPISAEDLEFAVRLGDDQAARFWRALREQRVGVAIVQDAEAAVEFLSRNPKIGSKKESRRPKGVTRSLRRSR